MFCGERHARIVSSRMRGWLPWICRSRTTRSPSATGGRDSRHSQSIAKLYGGIKANEIVDRMLQIHGGMGYTRELPLERWYRELRLLRIYEGTGQIQRRP